MYNIVNYKAKSNTSNSISSVQEPPQSKDTFTSEKKEKSLTFSHVEEDTGDADSDKIPSSFVEKTEEGSTEAKSPQKFPKRSSSLNQDDDDSSKAYPKYVCILDYEAAKSDEISISEGDVIFVEQVYDDGWALALNAKNGKKGSVPFNVLEKT
ncbi:hypothetical protein HZS_1076 [Henneguya salminicola]|nr:hypothetical protein HZS_1076 [Henneguya salminicola]